MGSLPGSDPDRPLPGSASLGFVGGMIRETVSALSPVSLQADAAGSCRAVGSPRRCVPFAWAFATGQFEARLRITLTQFSANISRGKSFVCETPAVVERTLADRATRPAF